MASSIDIVTDDRFTDLVADVVRKHFPDIRQYVPKIQGLIRTKTNKEGDVISGTNGSPVVLKKTPPIYTACEVPPYLMIIDGAFYNEASDHDIRGMIGNAILSIEVQVGSDDKGEDTVRFKSRKPDLVIFTEAVRMFGAFTPAVLKIRDIAEGVAKAALQFVEPREEAEPEPEEPPPSPPKPKARKKTKTTHTVVAEPENVDTEWSEPPRVRSADEIENEEALLQPARSSS